jgi:hypothetical protein
MPFLFCPYCVTIRHEEGKRVLREALMTKYVMRRHQGVAGRNHKRKNSKIAGRRKLEYLVDFGNRRNKG